MLRMLLTVAVVLLISAPVAAATIEFLSGNKLECKVLKKDDTTITVETGSGSKAKTRAIKLSLVHAVTINEKRYVVNERSGEPSTKSSGTQGSASTSAPGEVRRSKAEIDALINEVGRQPPEWFEATPLGQPESLDLSYPEKPPGGWDNQKNVGQYYWDVVNPNPSKWREGVKLMHHLLKLHEKDTAKRNRAMLDLGRIYHNLHEDYARAAFWWRAAGVEKNAAASPQAVGLAECYWKLGNKAMALELLGKARISIHMVKLYADMGDTKKSLALAERFVEDGGRDIAYLAVADGYRAEGKLKEALNYYERALAIANKPDAKRADQTKKRATASIEAVKLFDQADVSRVADGTHTAESLGYEGPVRVAVTVKAGRITDVQVVQHKEKQFYSALTDTPAKIIAKQGVKGVDGTSSATITSQAIINSAAKALASGAK